VKLKSTTTGKTVARTSIYSPIKLLKACDDLYNYCRNYSDSFLLQDSSKAEIIENIKELESGTGCPWTMTINRQRVIESGKLQFFLLAYKAALFLRLEDGIFSLIMTDPRFTKILIEDHYAALAKPYNPSINLSNLIENEKEFIRYYNTIEYVYKFSLLKEEQRADTVEANRIAQLSERDKVELTSNCLEDLEKMEDL
jgi:hypothetical protein